MILKDWLKENKDADFISVRYKKGKKGKFENRINFKDYERYYNCDIVKSTIEQSEAINPITSESFNNFLIATCYLDDEQVKIVNKGN